MLKFSNVCRICLQQEEEMISINEKSSDGEIDSDLTILEKIMQLARIEEDERYPQKICTTCLSDLEAGFRFMQNLQTSEEVLCASYVEDQHLEKDLDDAEQELPNDFYKTDVYDEHSDNIENTHEIIVMDNKNIESLEDALLEKHLDCLDIVSEPKKASKDRTLARLKRSQKTTSSSSSSQQVHICEICANQYKYRHALEVHMRRHRYD